MSCSAAVSTPTLTPLPWDSEQFGFPAARLEFRHQESGEDLAAALDAARSMGIRHVTARVPAEELGTIRGLQAAGFQLLDGILSFAIKLESTIEWPERVRLFRDADLPPVLSIARSSYRFDRFHADDSLPAGAADRLHESWVRNACSGLAADAVVVAESGGEAAAYVTCKLRGRTGSIVLVATAAAARGRGLGRAVTLGALAYFRQQGCDRVEVGTQIRNTPASRLYESLGFRLEGVSLTFRKLL